MKKIFVTGANGFIGHHLVNYLSENNYKIYALIRKKTLPIFSLRNNINIFYGDLTDKKSLIESIPRDSIIVNLAANPYHPKLSYEVNVIGTKNLIDVCNVKNVKKIIHISTQATKIKNQGVYAKTKNESDKIIKSSKVKYIILKPSLVYGEGEKGLFNKLLKLIDRLPFIPVFGNGEIKINPIYIEDFCYLIKKLIEDDKNFNQIYDIGSREEITYNEYYTLIIKQLGKEKKLIHIPVFLGMILGKLFTLFFKNPPFYIDNVLGSTQPTYCDPTILLNKYSYNPISFSEGIKKILVPHKLNIAIIGLGKMGMLHLSILNLIPEVKIVALVDTNKQIFTTLKSMGIKTNIYDNFDRLVAKEKVDAVFITTPTFTHYDLLQKAAAKNINVFIEKPLALNMEQIYKIKKIKSKAIMHVGYNLLFNKVYRYFHRLISNKKYGPIIGFKAYFKHSEVIGGPKKGWMFDKNLSGGGVLMNPGPHIFSLINLYFGKPKLIYGSLIKKYSFDVEDEADLILDYKNYKGKVFLSWSVKNKPISQTKIIVNFKNTSMITDGNKIKILDNNGKKTIIKGSDIPSLMNGVFNINPEANGDAYFIEDKLFIEAIIKNKRNSLNSLKFALDTESIIHKIYKNAIFYEYST